ncbi:MAG: cysteine peptidase family C39 domain-containing protein [Planctomycetota bacterium]
MEVAYYVVLALASIVAYALGLWVGRRGKRAAIVGYVLLLTLLLGKAWLNHNPATEFALFPWPDYAFFQSYAVFPLALACLGLATGLLQPGPNRRAVVVLAGFVFLVSLWTERWVVLDPDTSSKSEAMHDHHCLQTTTYSCGPAASVSVLSVVGHRSTEGEMMGLCATPAYGGTSMFRIYRGLRLRLPEDYDVRIVDGDPEALWERGDPAVISVRKIHVVAVRFEGDKAVVLDPASPSPQHLDRAAFEERFGGPAVVVSRRR